jgi:NAD+ synthase (glutamine-hydrolysing)
MARFFTPYAHNMVRVAAATPQMAVADPGANLAETVRLAREADAQAAALVVFPELGLSAYAIDDLLFQDALLDRVEKALSQLTEESRAWMPVLVVGAPLRWRDRLYNCAVIIHRGQILGVTPKSFLPNYREFYEKRHFVSGAHVRGETISFAGKAAPFGVDLLFAANDFPDFITHIEICEDLWAPNPPSTAGALAGAKVLANLSASNATIGKARVRHTLCAARSSACIAAYVFSAAGPGESTTDLAWDGQAIIYEAGELLAETARFAGAGQLCFADIDLDQLRQERMRLSSFRDAAEAQTSPFRTIGFTLGAPARDLAIQRPVARFPFVPDEPQRLDEDCFEAYNIQVQGLAQRLKASRTERAVIGVSGGLDSTQALIVAARAMDQLGRPRSNVLAFSLPGFATGDATRRNAKALMKALGVTADEIDIRPTAKRMLADLGHPFAEGEPVYDVTFENVQAGLRTDYLFRIANQRGGLVVGTGDLSELALGWCTYGVGDQMSHYNVNAGAPKTLIQHLIRWNAKRGTFGPDASRTLLRILDTEISPELVPAGADGKMQSTQSMIGPYALHDFFLHYTVRYGLRPEKIAYLAHAAWADKDKGAWPIDLPARECVAYDMATILHWLDVFARRFFATSQFKRSAMPNGPKLTSAGALSPRGDWRAPSDSSAAVWLDAIAELRQKLEATSPPKEPATR